MKRYIKLLLAIIPLLAPSCSEEVTVGKAEPQSLQIRVARQGYASAVETGGTKTSESGYSTNFEEGDTIGIMIEIDNVTANAAYTLEGGEWKHVPSTPELPIDDNGGYYLFYYPYIDSQDFFEVTEWVFYFDPLEDQSSYENYNRSDHICGYAALPTGSTELYALLRREYVNHALIEIEIPPGAILPLITENGKTCTPWNISGQTYRCIANSNPIEHTLTVVYVYQNTIFEWSHNLSTSSGYYYYYNISNSSGLTPFKVVYDDGSEEILLHGTQSNRIQYIRSPGKTITHIEILGRIHLIGRSADGSPLYLNLDANGDLAFRPAGPDGYIPIGSYAEFQLINATPGGLAGTYRQEADLDLMGAPFEWTAIGSDGAEFTGAFDGGGKSIANLYINKGTTPYQGLFGCLGAGGALSNINITSGSITGQSRAGGVAGRNYGSVTACSNRGAVTGYMITGGVVGANYGTVTACYNTGDVSGSSAIGGILGNMTGGGMTACYNTGSVSGTTGVGGMLGEMFSGTMAACYWLDVSGDNANYGTGYGSSAGTTAFGPSSWPAASVNLQWGTGDGGGDGLYWQDLGGWAGGNEGKDSNFPKLWFEP
jgi:hypothetical protein